MKKSILSIIIAGLLTGCATTAPPETFVSNTALLQQRQIETRKFQGIKENDLIVASLNVLQDLGFTVENSEMRLGVLTASKQRDATNAAEIAGAVLVAVLTGAVMPVSKDQTFRVALVVRPVTDSAGKPIGDSNYVRITFQRVVRKTDNSVVVETLTDQKLYEDFFEKLSKSVFIEGVKL